MHSTTDLDWKTHRKDAFNVTFSGQKPVTDEKLPPSPTEQMPLHSRALNVTSWIDRRRQTVRRRLHQSGGRSQLNRSIQPVSPVHNLLSLRMCLFSATHALLLVHALLVRARLHHQAAPTHTRTYACRLLGIWC
ncbi:unnamed protein product [Protopolystoma xenopodis]|uniref:Uncharacterized protein n=1 Tax=Protopolystoma xenopodis TaxID=117903 RepID=A0A448WRK3_9PLAT|nr:unnamed protein product [Protopolystoma xenopodis]